MFSPMTVEVSSSCHDDEKHERELVLVRNPLLRTSSHLSLHAQNLLLGHKRYASDCIYMKILSKFLEIMEKPSF